MAQISISDPDAGVAVLVAASYGGSHQAVRGLVERGATLHDLVIPNELQRP